MLLLALEGLRRIPTGGPARQEWCTAKLTSWCRCLVPPVAEQRKSPLLRLRTPVCTSSCGTLQPLKAALTLQPPRHF